MSTVDGPGNRLVAFLRGYTVDCLTCHTPYTIGCHDHCRVCLDTSGDTDDDTWDLLEPLTDGAMVDLEAIDDGAHRRITGGSNAAALVRELGVATRLKVIGSRCHRVHPPAQSLPEPSAACRARDAQQRARSARQWTPWMGCSLALAAPRSTACAMRAQAVGEQCGGEGGIRTRDTATNRIPAFQLGDSGAPGFTVSRGLRATQA